MKTTITYNNSVLDFESATHTALKKLFGYAKPSEKYFGEYEIPDGRVQIIENKEYKNLLKTDKIFSSAVKGDNNEDGIIVYKDYMTKKTERYIVVKQ